jgi:hypothetical protein
MKDIAGGPGHFFCARESLTQVDVYSALLLHGDMQMASAKQFQPLGITFLSCGVVFLAVGVATKMTAFWTMAPAFIVLGIVFLAKSRQK